MKNAYTEARDVFRRNLDKAMKEKGFSPHDVQARSAALMVQGKLEAGVRAENIYKYLRGECLPTKATLLALAMALELQPRDLVADQALLSESGGRRPGARTIMPAVKVRNYRGLERSLVVIRCVLPTATALSVAALIKAHLHAQGAGEIET